MKRFIYSRSYHFKASEGRRRHFFFTMLNRSGNKVLFRLRDKGNTDDIPAVIIIWGDVETTTFIYMDRKFVLRADECISKGYLFTQEGWEEKRKDRLKDMTIK